MAILGFIWEENPRPTVWACAVYPQGLGAAGRGGGCGVWLRLALVFFQFGSLGCLPPLRHPPEASEQKCQVDVPPP